MYIDTATMEDSIDISKKTLGIELPYDPTIPLLGIYPKETKLKKAHCTCTPIFTAALFTIARTRKQPMPIIR